VNQIWTHPCSEKQADPILSSKSLGGHKLPRQNSVYLWPLHLRGTPWLLPCCSLRCGQPAALHTTATTVFNDILKVGVPHDIGIVGSGVRRDHVARCVCNMPQSAGTYVLFCPKAHKATTLLVAINAQRQPLSSWPFPQYVYEIVFVAVPLPYRPCFRHARVTVWSRPEQQCFRTSGL